MLELFVDGRAKEKCDFSLVNHQGIGVFETFLIDIRSSTEVFVRGLEQHYSRLVDGSLFLQLARCPTYNQLLETIWSASESINLKVRTKFRCRVIVTDRHRDKDPDSQARALGRNAARREIQSRGPAGHCDRRRAARPNASSTARESRDCAAPRGGPP